MESGSEVKDWLIQDCRQAVGNCALWWGPNGSGYTCDLDQAGRYTEAEAKAQEQDRPTDRAVPYELACKHAQRHVRVDDNAGIFCIRSEKRSSGVKK